MAPVLPLEFIPQPLWERNLRSILHPSAWQDISRQIRSRHNICQRCQKAKAEHAHEVWIYDDQTCTSTLSAIEGVCEQCHEALHFGRSAKEGKAENAKAHLKNINHWTEEEFLSALKNASDKHRERSQNTWKVILNPDPDQREQRHLIWRADGKKTHLLLGIPASLLNINHLNALQMLFLQTPEGFRRQGNPGISIDALLFEARIIAEIARLPANQFTGSFVTENQPSFTEDEIDAEFIVDAQCIRGYLHHPETGEVLQLRPLVDF